MQGENDTKWYRALKLTIARRFNLHLDKADEEDVILSIKKNTDFIGANLWTLIFAIFIASIGLNVNSTAVIIGAMLISPLMGPIMGIGLGVGINDFELVKKGGRNLLVATLISIATSTIYFLVTPLHEAQSELLARTTPSVWDVFIAFFGGLAGIVAGTRREKSNVIPGVAIATALMPPLCTAGYGIASGHIYYFFGALYLYFINSVFICISTFLIVRFLRFRKKSFEDKAYERRIGRYIFAIVLITLLPSIYLAYGIVQKSIFESNAQRFVRDEFRFKNTQVVNRNYKYSTHGSEIELLLIGYELSREQISAINRKLKAYDLDHTRLTIRQGLNAKQEIDFSQIKASILEDMFKKDSAALVPPAGETDGKDRYPDITQEMKALYPGLNYYALSDMVLHRADTLPTDTITMVVADFSRTINRTERKRLGQWLKERLSVDTVKLVVD